MAPSVQRILVGTDGSPSAAEAVAWGGMFARATGAQLTLATVLSPDPAEDDAARAERRRRAEVLLAGDWSARAGDVEGGIRTVVLEGDPRVALLDAATADDVDALVLGSAGTGWFPALHLGHVAHAVAHHTTVPLVIVPTLAGSLPLERLVLGIDGSAGSQAALNWVARIAPALGAEVIAVHVHVPVPYERLAELAPELEAACAAWTAPLASSDTKYRVLIEAGWPARVIKDVVAREESGLVVVGTRGQGGFEDLRLGSTALQLLHHARVPVAVVPPPPGAA